jgi:hypothetical protein
MKGVIGERVEVDIWASRGALDTEWFDVESGQIVPGNSVEGGRRLEFRAPFSGDAVLHVKSQGSSLEGSNLGQY